MPEDAAQPLPAFVETVYRSDSRHVLATLIRLLGDFDPPKKRCTMRSPGGGAMAADGVPANPRAWLVSTGRFKAIDGMRRRARFDASLTEFAERLETRAAMRPKREDEAVEDDRLRLIFTCCHPALAPDAQVAMTLREVCGLTTEEIARAFLTMPPTIAQRIVRAKAKIRDARYSLSGAVARRICRTGWTPSCGWSTSCSTKDIRPRRANHSRGTIFRARRSAWDDCSCNCCRSRKRRTACADAAA